MQFSILFYQSPEHFVARNDPSKREEFWGSFGVYMKSLRDAGVVMGGLGLQEPDTTRSIDMRKAEKLVQDGPFANTKEQLGGFFIVDVADMDAAVEWARQCPAHTCTAVEVRPGLLSDR